MKKYYTLAEGKKEGPYTIDELKTKSFSADDDVWSEYDNDWFPVKAVPELKDSITTSSENNDDGYFGYRLASVKGKILRRRY